jgi:hypothetical protein
MTHFVEKFDDYVLLIGLDDHFLKFKEGTAASK